MSLPRWGCFWFRWMIWGLGLSLSPSACVWAEPSPPSQTVASLERPRSQAQVLHPRRPSLRLTIYAEDGRILRQRTYISKKWFRVPQKYRASGATAQHIEAAIQKASLQHGLSPALIRALIRVESGGGAEGVTAVSSANAQGLTQLLPGTAVEMGVQDTFNIEQNILGGAGYLKKQIERFQGLEEALVAYNWGPQNLELVRKGQKRIPASVQRYAQQVLSHYRLME